MTQFRCRLTSHPSHQRAEPGGNFIHLERLCHIIVGASVQTLDLFAPGVTRRQNQNRRSAARETPASQNLNTGQAGQAEIKHDRIELFLQCVGKTMLAVLDLLDDKAKATQSFFQAGADVAIVLDKQNTNDPFLRVATISTSAS